MMSRLFSALTLVVALMLGYTFFLSGDRSSNVAVAHAEIADYAISNAEVIETGVDGLTRIRFTAVQAALGYNSNSLALQDLRVDYQPNHSSQSNTTSSRPSMANSHWVAKSEKGMRTALNDVITLTGNVSVTNQGTKTPFTLTTQSMDLDIVKQIASSDSKSQINLGQHVVTGNRLRLDLPTQHLRLSHGAQIRLAANTLPTQLTNTTPSDGNNNAQDVFESDNIDFRLSDNSLHLTKVRSKSPPFITAEEATISGDMKNNQAVLQRGVRIELPPQGELVADSAIVTIQNGRVVFASALASNGQLIVFEHHPPSVKPGETVVWRGRALAIDFDFQASTLAMRDGKLSRILNGTTQFESEFPSCFYNLGKGEGGCSKVDQRRPTTTIHLPKDKLPRTPAL
jgi:LPS export ABC transporter protein LptC